MCCDKYKEMVKNLEALGWMHTTQNEDFNKENVIVKPHEMIIRINNCPFCRKKIVAQ